MPKYQVGHTPGGPTGGALKSMPKLTKINGDDSKAVIWRNLGNNHAYPFIWGHSVTLASGTTEITLASGVTFHGFELATYAKVIITETSTPELWDDAVAEKTSSGVVVIKNVAHNAIVIRSTAAPNIDRTFDVMYMLGENVVIGGMNCDGMWSDMPPTGYTSM